MPPKRRTRANVQVEAEPTKKARVANGDKTKAARTKAPAVKKSATTSKGAQMNTSEPATKVTTTRTTAPATTSPDTTDAEVGAAAAGTRVLIQAPPRPDDQRRDAAIVQPSTRG